MDFVYSWLEIDQSLADYQYFSQVKIIRP